MDDAGRSGPVRHRCSGVCRRAQQGAEPGERAQGARRRPYDYALGFEIAGSGAATSFAHGGSNRGYQNHVFGYLDGGRGAVVMTNGDAGDEVARTAMRAIAAEYGWPSDQAVMRTAMPLDALMAQQMIGKYAIPGLGDFDIAVQDGPPMFWIKAGRGERLYRQSETRFSCCRNNSSCASMRCLRYGPDRCRAFRCPFQARTVSRGDL